MRTIRIHRPRPDIAIGLLRCLKEARPCVLVIFLLRFMAGAVLAAPAAGSVDAFRTCAGAFVWVTAIFFTYLINGVMDVREDRINGSARPIARGSLSSRFAAWVCAAAAVLSLAGGCALGARTAFAVTTVLIVGWLYSGPPAYLKRQAAGTAVGGAALGLLSYYAGLAVWTRPHPGSTFLIFAATLSSWMAIVGAPAKDLSDVPGDAAAGRRTLAVMCGEPLVRRLVACTAMLLAAGFSVVAWAVTPALRWPDAALVAGAFLVVSMSVTGLSQGGRGARRRPYRAFMVTQYATHICLVAGAVL